MEKSKLDLNLIDDAPSLDIAPWKLSAPAVGLDLAKFEKETTNPETHKQFYLQLTSEYPSSETFFTDGSKTEAGVAAASVSTKHPRKSLTCCLPDGNSIYTAELRAILLALKRIYCSKRKSFLILSHSLSSLKDIFNLKYEHHILVHILELYMDLTKDGIGNCLCLGPWPCGH